MAALAWLLLLGLSWVWRAIDQDEDRSLPAISVAGRDAAGAPLEGQVEIAWAEWGRVTPVPVILLHGSPGSHRDFGTLGPALGELRWALAPDLPGFGESSPDPPSLSIVAQAAQVEEWMNRLGIERAHLLGFSMGGGVALELGARAPARVASLTLLSSLGVEELELLGDHELNRGIHLVALGATRAVDHLVPHFGTFDDFPLGVAWARQFAETDQRRLRGHLERWQGPALIVHGRRDVLVPFAAAEESARLIPQSELVALEADHFVVFRGGPELVRQIEPFLAGVERGEARGRAEAAAERVWAAAAPWDPHSAPAAQGFALVLVGVLLALATFVSEDLTSITAGLLAAEGRVPFLFVAVACGVGIFVGDLLLFLTGRTLGRAAVVRRPLSWFVDAKNLEAASVWFRKRGAIVILVSRFTPGTRLATYVTAGVLQTPWWRFVGWFALSVVLWTPILVGLAMVFGRRLESVLGRGALALVVVALVLLVLVRGLLVPALTHRGRRRLVGRWLRLTRWELWPAWAVYPPILLWILVLGLRHRRLTAFTAVNPGFPNAGGFVGESKSAILRLLPADDPRVPAWALIPAGSLEERLRLLEVFQRESGLGFPIVLKPDVGERGQGVVICRDLDDAVTTLAEQPESLIAQEYLPGVEVGAFWVANPRSGIGSLFALTQKVVPTVVGDGRRTAAELVFDDPRAVALADLYLANLGARLAEVPGVGEVVRLAELGTHCRGAIFLDGARLVTPALERAVDQLSRRVPGFHFGRWDLRAASFEALQRGEFRVVELNGVTSEATVIYDPSYSPLDGWRVLARQWRLAFEIGAANAAAGAKVVGVAELVRLIWREWLRRR